MQQPNIITWFTQPANSFASFYYYDTATRNMVRIRLELNRPDNGNTNAYFTANRYVGFYQVQPPGTPGRLSTANPALFTVDAHSQIVFNNAMTLQQNPQVGLSVCDFSGPVPPNFVHKGNAVTNAPLLPPGVDLAVLTRLAQRVINLGATVPLTAYNASAAALSQAVINASNQ